MTIKCRKFGVLTAKNISITVFRDAYRSPKKAINLTLQCLLMLSIYYWKTVEVVIPIYIYIYIYIYKGVSQSSETGPID